MNLFWSAYAKSPSTGRVEFDEYERVYLLMCKALNARFDRSECEALARTDWERDTQRTGSMNQAMCFNSLFEIADLWTRTVLVEDYVAFLVFPRSLSSLSSCSD